MKPSIEVYNNIVTPNEYNVNDYISDFPFLSFPADLNIYEYLTRFICSCIDKKIPITFIHSHEEIINLIKEWYCDGELGTPDIINIDHHHDIGYDITWWDKPVLKAECGNWVKFGKDNNLIGNYTWIRNDNSNMPPEKAMKYLDGGTYTLNQFSLDNLVKRINHLIICRSFDWIPEMYQPLFFTWPAIEQEITN